MQYGGACGEKQRIRAEIRRIAQSLDRDYYAGASRRIAAQVLALPSWRRAKTVMAYVSMPEEPDTRELLEAVLREGRTLLLPRCVDNARMEALPVEDLSALVPGLFGIPEPAPAEGAERVPEPDLILVPCVAASPGGARLGHGAAYYDRFLAGHPGERVCLCFRPFLRSDLPTEATDIPMDRVITD